MNIDEYGQMDMDHMDLHSADMIQTIILNKIENNYIQIMK